MTEFNRNPQGPGRESAARVCRRTEGPDNGSTSHGGAGGGAARETTVPGEQPQHVQARAVASRYSGPPA